MSLLTPSRKTSLWKMNTNANVSTVQNTHETVYSLTGAGYLTAISIAALNVTDLRQCIVEVTVDGGAIFEIDMNIHFKDVGGDYTWHTGKAAFSLTIPIHAEFNTSILVRAKNDFNTDTIVVSISASEDQ